MRTSDTVRESLERDISRGTLRPGDTIDEKSLTERFQISRTPAREAILQLAASGLVKIRPRHGAEVAGLNADEAIAMMETLAALEADAACLAARRIQPDEREALARVHAQSESAARAGDSAAYQPLNTRFHEIIYDSARNPYMADLIRQTRIRMAYYRANSLSQPSRVSRSWHEHSLVVEAIVAGDTAAAQAAMRDHILSGGRVFADLVAAISHAQHARSGGG
ncbi:MAG: GntR family transcriptional regulator [Roseinatronobacter sp.]